MLIDAHAHPNYHGHDAAKIVQNLDEQGIDTAWLLTWDTPQSEYDAPLNQRNFNPATESGVPLADVIEAGRYAPERFVLGYAPHPKRPDAILRLRSAVDMYGIQLGGEYKFRLPFDDQDSLDLLRAMGELGLPVTIHLEYGTEYEAGEGGGKQTGTRERREPRESERNSTFSRMNRRSENISTYTKSIGTGSRWKAMN